MMVRHGGTIWSSDDRFAGASDVQLSEAGRAQASALGKRLAGQKIDAAYCSPMTRALETAGLVCAGRELTVVTVPELREIDHGRWEGRTPAEIKSQWAQAYAEWEADPLVVAA